MKTNVFFGKRICCFWTGARIRGRDLVVFFFGFTPTAGFVTVLGLVSLLSRLWSGYQSIPSCFPSTCNHRFRKVIWTVSTRLRFSVVHYLRFNFKGYEKPTNGRCFPFWKRAKETRRNWWKRFYVNWGSCFNRRPDPAQSSQVPIPYLPLLSIIKVPCNEICFCFVCFFFFAFRLRFMSCIYVPSL